MKMLDNVEIKYIGTTTTTLDPLTIQRNANFISYGIAETDEEQGERQEEEAQVQFQFQQMVIAQDVEKNSNVAETGYYETDEERAVREQLTNVVIIVGDQEVTYTEKQQEQGDIERDLERERNQELYGVALTDEQITRGDLELYDVEITEDDLYEQEEQFINDDDVLDAEQYEYDDQEYIELQKEMEREALEDEQEILSINKRGTGTIRS